MRAHITRSGLTLAAAALTLLLAACSGGASTPEIPNAGTTDSNAAETPAETSGDGDYAFGTDRDQVATAIEAAFTRENGTARWEGGTLVLAVDDGDAGEEMAGFTQCRVLLHILQEDDESVIEFPNGRVACADALAVG